MNRNSLLSIAGVTLLLLAVLAIAPLEEDPLTDLRMNLLSDRVQEVSYGETAVYNINVRNEGDYNRHVHLEPTNVPEHWSASLSKDYLILSGHSQTIVTLSVTAPSANAAGIRGLDTIASIGVRSENVTIGTITILQGGSATVLRDGTIRTLYPESSILSGDIVTTHGNSVITLDVSKFIYDGQAEGNIYVLLRDAVVGFLRYQDVGYLWIISGEVLVWVPDGGGTGVPTVNLSKVPVINSEFPGREYNAVVEFVPPFEEHLFLLNVTAEQTKAEVYEGALELKNDDGTRTLENYEQTTGERTGVIPEPTCLEKTIVMLESDGCVGGWVRSKGVDILENEDVYYLPAGNREYYIIPPDVTDITLDLTGRTDGSYTVSFTSIKDCTSKSFELTTTGSLSTTDTFVFSENELGLREMEPDKTYDLTITYENTVTTKFEAVDIKTSDEDQGFEVTDWENLGDKDKKPVTASEGDKEVKVSTGITGDELEEEFKEEEKKISVWVWISLLIILILIVLAGGYYWIAGKEKKKEEEEKFEREEEEKEEGKSEEKEEEREEGE